MDHPKILAAIERELIRRGIPARARAQLVAVGQKLPAGDADDLPALTRLAARLEPTFRRAFLAAIARAQNVADLESLAVAIQGGNIASISAAATIGLGAALQGLPPIIRRGFDLGAGYGAEVLSAAGLSIRLDLMNPHAAAWASGHSGELISGLTAEAHQAIKAVLAQRIAEGVAPREMAREIMELIGLTPRQVTAVMAFQARLLAEGIDLGLVAARTDRYAVAQLRARAMTIARTETLTASNAGQQGLWREARAQGLLDPATTRRRWMVTNDDRLDTEICEPLDGVEVGLEEAFPGGYLHPPAHPSCLPGHTLITPCGPITAQSERWYEGELTVILTAGGHQLACTPNHPILTPHGWMAAGLVKEGGYVIGSLRRQGMTSVRNGNYEMQSRIEDVAHTVRHSLQMMSAEMPVTPKQFHGDGRGSKIAVIRTHRHLRNHRDPAINQPAPQPMLQRRLPTLLFDRRSLGAQTLHGCPRPAYRAMGRLSLMLPIFPTHVRPFDSFRLGSVTEGHGTFSQNPCQDRTAYPKVSRQLLDGSALLVEIDQVIEVRRIPFTGHVYNLQTTTGWYIASGIITHNCRCSLALVFKER